LSTTTLFFKIRIKNDWNNNKWKSNYPKKTAQTFSGFFTKLFRLFKLSKSLFCILVSFISIIIKIFKFFLSFLNFFKYIFSDNIYIFHNICDQIYIIISLFQYILHKFLILGIFHFFISQSKTFLKFNFLLK